MTRQEKIAAIISAYFGDILGWKPPVFVPSPCPQSNDVFDDFIKQRSEKIDAVHLVLNRCADEVLEAAFEANGQRAWTVLQKAPIDDRNVWLSAIQIKLPMWFSGGLGVDGYQADFEYWAKMEKWSPIECFSLSIGLDPKHLPLDEANETKIDSNVVDFLEKRSLLIKQKFQPYDSHHKFFCPSPKAFCDWLIEKKVDAPDALFSAVFPRAVVASLPLENRERESVLKMIIALAVGSYGFDPNAERSAVAKEIRSDLNKIGLDLSEDTIRKYLREARAVLPEDFKAE